MKIKEVKIKSSSVKITHQEFDSTGEDMDVTIESFDIEKMSNIIKALKPLEVILIKFCGLEQQAWSGCLITSIAFKTVETVDDYPEIQVAGQIAVFCEKPVKVQTPFIPNSFIDKDTQAIVDSVFQEVTHHIKQNVKYMQLSLI